MWRGQRTYNGIAILAKTNEPVLTRDRLPGDPADGQSRYVEAAVRGFLIASIYLPEPVLVERCIVAARKPHLLRAPA